MMMNKADSNADTETRTVADTRTAATSRTAADTRTVAELSSTPTVGGGRPDAAEGSLYVTRPRRH